MLHYFAKKFFSATILSAFVEQDDVSLYYINDDVFQQTREFHGHQTQHRLFHSKHFHGSEIRQFGNRLNDVLPDLTHLLESQLNHSTYTAKEGRNPARATDDVDDDEGDVDDMTVYFKHAANTFNELYRAQEDCIVKVQCFRWSSFEPSAEWNITFRQVRILCVVRLYTCYLQRQEGHPSCNKFIQIPKQRFAVG